MSKSATMRWAKDKRRRARTEEVKAKISETEKTTKAKKTADFLAADPKCKECDGPFERYSVSMICTKCLKIKHFVTPRKNETWRAKRREYSKTFRQKNRKRIREKAREYYKKNKIKIKLRAYHRQQETAKNEA